MLDFKAVLLASGPRIIPEKAIQFNLDDTQEGLLKDPGAHFGCAFSPVRKYNRHFHYIEAIFNGGKFHFDRKGISNEFDTVERDCL